jgi:pimeloyl-ACP methyl ester carboxylesterase
MRAWPVLCATLLLGTIGVAQRIDVGPAPGRLVDVGGRRLHLNCSGSGSPTVILEAGASAFALDWSLVQPGVARTNRVCSYDRAGLGWSDARPDVDTPARVVADLRRLLSAAGERPPLVLVGASWGGLYARLYLLDHAEDVAGLVLVDPSTEDGLFTMFEGKDVAIASLSAEQLASTLPASGSVPIPRRPAQRGAPFDRLPPELYQLRITLDGRVIASMPPSVGADIVRESSEGQRAALARLSDVRAAQERPMGDRPLIVLTRGQGGSAEAHARLARQSANSRHTIVPEAGHEIHLFVPAAVVSAIQDVSLAVRQKQPLPPNR